MVAYIRRGLEDIYNRKYLFSKEYVPKTTIFFFKSTNKETVNGPEQNTEKSQKNINICSIWKWQHLQLRQSEHKQKTQKNVKRKKTEQKVHLRRKLI